MARTKTVRLDVTGEQFANLRQEVFCNQQLSGGQRRREVGKLVPLPKDGSRVDVYFEGNFVGTI